MMRTRFNFGPRYVSVVVLFVVFSGVLWTNPAWATKFAGAFMEDGGGARAGPRRFPVRTIVRAGGVVIEASTRRDNRSY